jgi:RHS repeat-associated protein
VPGFSHVAYDFKDQMLSSARQIVSEDSKPEMTYYVYNAAGQRVRKVTEAAIIGKDKSTSPSIVKETLYLDGLDISTVYTGDIPKKTWSCLRVSDGVTTIALRETLKEDDQPPKNHLWRYQLAGHLPSVSIELDNEANVISYEEYSPFGSTTLMASSTELKMPKRYRFSGKELDVESGLSYFGRRYFCASAARWTCSDPLGLADGLNTWAYVGNDPVNRMDSTGLCGEENKAHEATHTIQQKQGGPSKSAPPNGGTPSQDTGGGGSGPVAVSCQ